LAILKRTAEGQIDFSNLPDGKGASGVIKYANYLRDVLKLAPDYALTTEQKSQAEAAASKVKEKLEVTTLNTFQNMTVNALRTLTRGLAGTIQSVTAWVAAKGLLNVDTSYLKPGGSFQAAIDVIKNIANVVFIVILALIGLANIISFRLDTYALRKTIPYLIIAIVFVNLAQWVTVIPINFANSLTDAIVSTNANKAFGGMAFEDNPNLANEEVWGYLGAYLLGLLMFVIFFIAIFIYVLVAFVRQLFLYILAIFAPLAFAALAFPPLSSYFKKWWELFFNLLVMGVLMALGLYLTIVIISSPYQPPLTLTTSPISASGGFDQSGGGNFFSYLMGGLLLFGSAFVPARFGGKYFAWAQTGMTNAFKALPKVTGGALGALGFGMGVAVRGVGFLPKIRETEWGKKMQEFKGLRMARPMATFQAIRQAIKEKQEGEQKVLAEEWAKKLGAVGQTTAGKIFGMKSFADKYQWELGQESDKIAREPIISTMQRAIGKNKNTGKEANLLGRKLTHKTRFSDLAYTHEAVESKNLNTIDPVARAMNSAWEKFRSQENDEDRLLSNFFDEKNFAKFFGEAVAKENLRPRDVSRLKEMRDKYKLIIAGDAKDLGKLDEIVINKMTDIETVEAQAGALSTTPEQKYRRALDYYKDSLKAVRPLAEKVMAELAEKGISNVNKDRLINAIEKGNLNDPNLVQARQAVTPLLADELAKLTDEMGEKFFQVSQSYLNFGKEDMGIVKNYVKADLELDLTTLEAKRHVVETINNDLNTIERSAIPEYVNSQKQLLLDSHIIKDETQFKDVFENPDNFISLIRRQNISNIIAHKINDINPPDKMTYLEENIQSFYDPVARTVDGLPAFTSKDIDRVIKKYGGSSGKRR